MIDDVEMMHVSNKARRMGAPPQMGSTATTLISAGAKGDESFVLNLETKAACGVLLRSQLADKH